jgi:hypothetical protein
VAKNVFGPCTLLDMLVWLDALDASEAFLSITLLLLQRFEKLLKLLRHFAFFVKLLVALFVGGLFIIRLAFYRASRFDLVIFSCFQLIIQR